MSTTHEEAKKWKRELVGMRFKGFSLDRCAELLSEKYGIKKSSIKQKWYERKNWMSEVFDVDLESGTNIIEDLITEERLVKYELWNLKDSTNNPNAKLGALKQINKINTDVLDMLQSTGIIKREPKQIEFKNELKNKIQDNDDAKEAIKKIYQLEKELDEQE